MGDIKLFCLLQGQRLEQSFGMKLSRESDVDDLRKFIIAECDCKLKSVAPGDLRLYRISIADDIDLGRLDLGENQPLLPRATIDELFPGIPGKCDYILVANAMMRSYLGFAMLMALNICARTFHVPA